MSTIQLLTPHYENPTLTHIDVVSLHPRNILLRWHDGTEPKGSLIAIPHNREPDEETGEVDMEFSDGELAALVDAYLTEQANKPAPVPYEVTRRQLFLVLDSELSLTRDALRAGLTTEAQRIEFDEALSFHRDHPMVANMGTSLGLNPAQIDDLFRIAATLT